jgi:hypothetical protein
MTIREDDLCGSIEVTVDGKSGCVKLSRHRMNVVYLSPDQMRELVAWWERREQGEETI